MYDHLEVRCPKLGGQVTFAYCQKEGGDLPCRRTMSCWQPYFPVVSYLRTTLTESQWDRCFCQKPKETIASLVELIEAAQKRQQEDI